MSTFERYLLTFAAAAAMAAPGAAQPTERRATFTGNGGNDAGKCTIEVYVDGSADVEVRGDSGLLRTLAGQPAQWRRFVCSGPMPANPADFQFIGVDGRGRQELIQDPRNNRGAAVVRVQDPDGGAEGYTFDLVWRGGGFDSRPAGQQPWSGRDRGPSAADAVRSCQEAVRESAMRQYGLSDIDFGNLNADDSPGRNDTIIGSFDVRRGNNRDAYRFSCAIDLAHGSVRGVEISRGQDAPTAGPSVTIAAGTTAAGTTPPRHASVRPSSASSAMDTGTCNSVAWTRTATAATTGLPGPPQRNGATTGAPMTSTSAARSIWTMEIFGRWK